MSRPTVTATIYRADDCGVYRPRVEKGRYPLSSHIEGLTDLRDGEVILAQWDTNKDILAFRASVPPTTATIERVSL